MAEEEWTKVADEEELKEGEPTSVKVGKKSVMLVKIEGEIHACGGKCTHYGAPLARGLLHDHTITCPWHSARFDVRSGDMVSPPALEGVGCYPVKVDDGQVYLGPRPEPEPPEIQGEDDRTFVIVGAGAAGNAAAETLRREGFAGRLVMITAEPDRPYDRPTLSKEFLGGEAPKSWLPLHSEEFYELRKVELLTERRVTGLDPEGKTLTFRDGERLAFDKALLATGGVPRRLDVPGADFEDCFLLRSKADAQAIVEKLEEAEQVVVVGAGFIGMEAASALRERDIEVHVIAPEDVPMARLFGDEVGRWLHELHCSEGVFFHMGSTVEEFTGDDFLEGVRLSDGTSLSADVAIIGVGIRPATDYLEETGLLEDGAVPVDGTLQTEVEDIYAAGDIALVPLPGDGERRRVEHWVVAERQGQHAARAMLGEDSPYEELPFFWTMQHGVSLKYVGYGRGYDATALRGSIDDGEFIVGYYADGALNAASGAGPGADIITVAEVLQKGGSIEAESFEDEETDLSEFLPED